MPKAIILRPRFVSACVVGGFVRLLLLHAKTNEWIYMKFLFLLSTDVVNWAYY